MRIITRAVLAALLLVPVAMRRSEAQDAQCRSLHRSNFRLNSAMLYIAQGDSTNYSDQKRSYSQRALRVLNDAAAAGGTEPFSMWYLFGRAYLLGTDIVGADSALTKAAALAPSDAGCQTEITRMRRNVWVPLQQEAVGQLQSRNYDSALVLLRRSNLIYREDPGAYMNMANAFLNKQMDDSAAWAYRMAAHAGTSADRADLRASSALNAARLMAQNHQTMAAESMYHLYLTMKPNDIAAKGALATLLNEANRPQEAAAIYDSILASSATLEGPALFSIAGSLFRLAQQDSVNRDMWFRKSVRAYEAGLAKSPYDREALFFTSNIYLVLADTQKLLQTAQRLVAVDSMNRRSLSLLAQGQQMAGQRPEVVRTLMRRDSLPFEVNVQSFRLEDSSATIRGGVQNLKTREQAGFNLTIEFLNGRGEVVGTERAEIPTLGAVGSAGAAYDFSLQGRGRGIIAYRYKVGG